MRLVAGGHFNSPDRRERHPGSQGETHGSGTQEARAAGPARQDARGAGHRKIYGFFSPGGRWVSEEVSGGETERRRHKLWSLSARPPDLAAAYLVILEDDL